MGEAKVFTQPRIIEILPRKGNQFWSKEAQLQPEYLALFCRPPPALVVQTTYLASEQSVEQSLTENLTRLALFWRQTGSPPARPAKGNLQIFEAALQYPVAEGEAHGTLRLPCRRLDDGCRVLESAARANLEFEFKVICLCHDLETAPLCPLLPCSMADT
jgi:hypothetical protein